MSIVNSTQLEIEAELVENKLDECIKVLVGVPSTYRREEERVADGEWAITEPKLRESIETALENLGFHPNIAYVVARELTPDLIERMEATP